MKRLSCLILLVVSLSCLAQDSIPNKPIWLKRAEHKNPKRLIGFVGVSSSLYAGAMVGLNYLWYADFERTSFQWFDDSREWQQIDKMGHVLGANFQANWYYQGLRWAGINNKKATWGASVAAWGMQSSIEILDGFSEEWGASGADILANTVGIALFIPQQLIWKEQRIQMKMSFHKPFHPDPQMQARADELFGTGFLERMIKDYNSTTFWLSFNTSSFFPNQKRAKWLNISVGYGARGMYGGFANAWTDDNNDLIIRTDVERYRSFFLSLDVDLTKIKTRSRYGKLILGMLNVFKLPFPAIEVNTKGEILFHSVHFLNWSTPLYIKK